MASDAVDRPRFDVYAMLLVLSFVLTGVASYILNDDLSSNYGFKLFGDKDSAKRATHITAYHDFNKKDTPYADVRAEDIEDWKAINPGKEFPIQNYKWPEGYDVYTNPVLDQDNIATIPADQREKLMKDAEKEPTTAPETPVVPPAEKPADTATPPTDKPTTPPTTDKPAIPPTADKATTPPTDKAPVPTADKATDPDKKDK